MMSHASHDEDVLAAHAAVGGRSVGASIEGRCHVVEWRDWRDTLAQHLVDVADECNPRMRCFASSS
jgi:hypothetical protein